MRKCVRGNFSCLGAFCGTRRCTAYGPRTTRYAFTKCAAASRSWPARSVAAPSIPNTFPRQQFSITAAMKRSWGNLAHVCINVEIAGRAAHLASVTLGQDFRTILITHEVALFAYRKSKVQINGRNRIRMSSAATTIYFGRSRFPTARISRPFRDGEFPNWQEKHDNGVLVGSSIHSQGLRKYTTYVDGPLAKLWHR